MKIKQVEELVGITQKNIRFYEEQGLLEVERAQNGYREYSLDDVKRLRQIKMLRLISVPIEDIRLLFSSKKSLDDILDNQIDFMEKQRESMARIGDFCNDLKSKNLSFESLDVEKCLEQIEQLEKEGTQFMDIQSTDVHLKKKLGAGLSAIFIIGLMLMLIIFFIQESIKEPIPIIAQIFIYIFPVLVIVGLIIAFIQRNKEIEGGEEDEASKY